MRELITLVVCSGLFFTLFLVTLTIGLIMKHKNLKIAAFVLLTCFFVSTAWTGIRLLRKSYNKVTQTLKPRSGIEIYSALFGSDEHSCVKVIRLQDEIVPGLDDGIWLQFETCPAELRRVLSGREFTLSKRPTKFEGHEEWISDKIMGDTILIFEYHAKDRDHAQTVWTSADSTQAVCWDLYY